MELILKKIKRISTSREKDNVSNRYEQTYGDREYMDCLRNTEQTC